MSDHHSGEAALHPFLCSEFLSVSDRISYPTMSNASNLLWSLGWEGWLLSWQIRDSNILSTGSSPADKRLPLHQQEETSLWVMKERCKEISSQEGTNKIPSKQSPSFTFCFSLSTNETRCHFLPLSQLCFLLEPGGR